MIINTNEIILKDSGLPLNNSVIIVHDGGFSNRSTTSSTMSLQLNFYASVEKYTEGVGNYLTVDGFSGKDKKLGFEMPDEELRASYYFDVQVKAHLMKLFPEWDEAKLVLTTEPAV